MPEQEREDETHADAHDPCDQHAHEQSQVGQGLEDCDELWHRLQLRRKDLCLGSHLLQLRLLVHRLLLRRRLSGAKN